jgi:cytochrome c553
MLPVQLIVALVAGIAIAALLFGGAHALSGHTVGRVVLLVGLVALPLLLSAGNISYGVSQSSTTGFCLSCHEMQRHGKSLFADNRQALAGRALPEPLRRSRDRLLLVPQGLRDVRRREGEAERIAARVGALHRRASPRRSSSTSPTRTRTASTVTTTRAASWTASRTARCSSLYAGTTSCLSCHRIAHDMAKVDAEQFWQAH